MEGLQDAIQHQLPELETEMGRSLSEHLRANFGVENINNLEYVQPEDIKDHLTPIQCRELLQSFKQRREILINKCNIFMSFL